jgi:hypothetical protein
MLLPFDGNESKSLLATKKKFAYFYFKDLPPQSNF